LRTALRAGILAGVSYDLHIIRTDDWTTADENPISFDEWTNHARAAPTLVEAGMISLGDTEPSEQPVFALAHGTSLHWWRGEIVATLADESDVAGLLPIAVALSARVQGDDGEFYE
jgi:hypothetical protein